MFSFGIKDAIDILLVAFMLYYFYTIMRRSRSANIFYGIVLFASFWIVVSKVLEMRLLGGIMDQLVSLGSFVLVIIFQDDIRHFFYSLGTHEKVRDLRLTKWLFQYLHSDSKASSAAHVVKPLLLACTNMSKNKVGALIVVQNRLPMEDIKRTGEAINAIVSQRLVENIFFKNSPLHDGAMLICGDRITAAACILPVSSDSDIPKQFGLRHRAAIGLSKEVDALAIVVSEETGHITLVHEGKYRSQVSAEELEQALMNGTL